MPEIIAQLVAAATIATMTATAYDNTTGAPPYAGLTFAGVIAAPGTAACGPSLPLGTLIIPLDPMPHAAYVCLDRGGKITDDRLDIWLESYGAARSFGRRTVHVAIVQTERSLTP